MSITYKQSSSKVSCKNIDLASPRLQRRSFQRRDASMAFPPHTHIVNDCFADHKLFVLNSKHQIITGSQRREATTMYEVQIWITGYWGNAKAEPGKSCSQSNTASRCCFVPAFAPTFTYHRRAFYFIMGKIRRIVILMSSRGTHSCYWNSLLPQRVHENQITRNLLHHIDVHEKHKCAADTLSESTLSWLPNLVVTKQ